MAELIAGIIIALAGGVTLVALLTTISFLAPGLSGRSARALAATPGRSFILGLVNFLFFFTIAVVLAQIGQAIGGFFGGLFTLAALVIAFVLVLLAAVGLAGLVNLLRDRAFASAAPLAGTMRAGALLVAGALAPVAGWFILAPLALLTGLGAAIIALVQGLRPSSATTPPTVQSASQADLPVD